MSTKVYVAYRMKRGAKLWPLAADLRARGEYAAWQTLSKTYAQMIANKESEHIKEILAVTMNGKLPNVLPPELKIEDASRFVRKRYGAQLGDPQREIFSLDVAIAIHEHRGRLYLLPYCDGLFRRTLDFMKRHPQLEDFSYWDNVDQPKNITEREWDARGKVWDQIVRAGWRRFLTLEIVTFLGFMSVDPWLVPCPKITSKK